MKMAESELLCLADRLQSFVAQGSYREAEVCFDEYCRMFKAAVQSLAPGDPRLRQMEIEWRRLYEQTRQQVLAGRAHAASRLERLRRPTSYFSAAAPPPTWELLG